KRAISRVSGEGPFADECAEEEERFLSMRSSSTTTFPGSGRFQDSYDRSYMPRWENTGGKIKVGTAVVDEKGRVLIPLEDRTRAGLKPGVELEISQQKQGLLLRPVTPKPIRVRASRAKWGKEAFQDAGEATFGG